MRIKRKIVNLFKDSSTSNIKQVISISNEEDLNQFWDYLNRSSNQSYELTHNFITQFYNFALSYLLDDDSQFFEVILEENEENIYFTLWNQEIALLFQTHIKYEDLSYIYDKNRISIKLNKLRIQKTINKIAIKHQDRENKLIESVKIDNTDYMQEAYSFVSDEDLEELLKLNDDMQELLFQINKFGLDENSFITLRSLLSLFCLTLRYYEEIANIANIITDFSNLINTNKEKFTNLSNEEQKLITGFINNIDTWLHTLFIKGGADLYFMDNSIQADLTTISQIIIPPTSQEEEINLDDIFDF